MKKALFRIAAGLILAAATFAGGLAWADDRGGSESAPQVDVWGNVGGFVDTANQLGQTAEKVVVGVLMDRKHAGTLLDKVSDALSKAGVNGGRVLQAQTLNKIAGAVDKLVNVFDFGIAAIRATEAWKAGDREAFNKIVADYLIDVASGVIGQVVETAVFSFLTGSTCGVGALPGYVAGAAAGWAATEGSKWLLQQYAQEHLEKLGDALWDMMRDEDQTDTGPTSGGTVSAADLEELDGTQGNGGGDNGKGSNNGGRKSGYQPIQGIKAHQWGSK